MKKVKHIFAVLVLLLTFGFNAQAQSPDDVFKKVSAAISKGDVNGLSPMFNNSVDVTVPSADETYSKVQATGVLKNFFANYSPTGFKVVHKGNSGATHYCTGSYASAKGSFDTNIFLKNINGQLLITQIRFEEK